MENKEKQVRKIAQRVMTKYKLHPPVDMMGLIQEKGITCVEENLGTNADGYSDLKDSDLKIVLNSAIQYEPRKRFTLAHVLLTSTQLLCLYIEVCKNPICKEERITELLSCVGKYERYREIKDYLK